MTPPKKTPQEEITQMHFPFRDYKDAFKAWKDNLHVYGDQMQMVLSEHAYTSGYWIEAKGKPLTKSDKVYIGNEVLELEKRVLKAVDQADKNGHFINYLIK